MRPDGVARIFSRSVIDIPGNPSSPTEGKISKTERRHVHYDEFERDSKTTFTQQKGCFLTFWRIALLATLIVGALLLVGLLVGYLTPCDRVNLKHIQAQRRISENPRGRNEQNTSVSVNHEENEKRHKSVRLPRNVTPIHYKLGIQPHLPPEEFKTDGYVEITIRCENATDRIVLHAIEIQILSVNVTGDGQDDDLSVSAVSNDTKRQLLTIQLENRLRPKRYYVISMQFTSEINDHPAGFFRTSYTDLSGNESWMAVSQLQATDARRVFPCFDEPALKATFEVAIIRKKDMISLSNMPSWKTEPWSEEWEVDLYNTTVPMSTYLLAFVVGRISPFEEENEKFQVWSRESSVKFGEYAYFIGPKLLEFYEEFFGVSYPLPKTDMVAVPKFIFAAMENWGLIIYEESALLYDPKRSSLEDKMFVTVVVAHELAHQWFGNLVTPSWWDDLWLNEGFATYVEYLGAAAVQPEWGMDQQFLTDVYEVMETDCLSSSHAIRSPASDPDEIMELFDDISYLKGGTIIRMMEHFIGSENFRKGLQTYLQELSFKSATQEDLWHHLNQSSGGGEDVQNVMDTWTLQSGYPLITVNRNYESNSTHIRQTAYYMNTQEDDEETKRQKLEKKIWTIPITYTDGVNTSWEPSTDIWLKNETANITDLTSDDTWLILNVQQVGYYRVNYDLRNWNLLILQLVRNHSVIHTINRGQILNDALNLARSGHLPYPLALNITIYLLKETEYLPWKAAFLSFRYMDYMLGKTEAYGMWKEYVLLLTTPTYLSLGWTPASQDETLITSFLRGNILRWSCNYGSEHCIETAIKYFQQWKRAPKENKISPDVLDIVLCTGIAHGNSKDWDFVWKIYLEEDLKTQKNTLLKSLACAREPWLLERLLTWVIKRGSEIKIQDGGTVFEHVAHNVYGRDVLYNFFRKNLNEIFDLYGSHGIIIGKIVEYSSAAINTEFEAHELRSFKKRRGLEGWSTATSVLQRAIERSSINVHWMIRYYAVISQWLQQQRSEYV